MKVLFATSECAPFIKTGGLGDVSAALPPALASLGHEVMVLMPAYPDIPSQGQITGLFTVPAEGPWPVSQLLRMEHGDGVALLLLVCPQLYARAGSPYADASGTEHGDNALRFGLLSRVAALIATPRSPCGWTADIVHANDWPTALAPLYLQQYRRTAGQGTVTARSVMTVHNLAFQGVVPMDWAPRLEIHEEYLGVEGVEFWGQLSTMKAGLQFADAITTVSPTYAREIQTPALGFGLDGVLRSRSGVLRGILNGIDTALWNPLKDPLIAAPFSSERLEGKAINKTALRDRLGLAHDEQRLLFGLVSRLTQQKGIDWVIAGAERLLNQGGQLAVLGSGDAALEAGLQKLAQRHRLHMSVTIGFDESLAHQIEAGADSFLMPSRFEPCGLNQMYSQIYGTLPLVSPTGGLADSVVDADAPGERGTGFVMEACNQAAFDRAVDRALAFWKLPHQWRQLQQSGMRCDFGWSASALAYQQVYEQV